MYWMFEGKEGKSVKDDFQGLFFFEYWRENGVNYREKEDRGRVGLRGKLRFIFQTFK